MITHEAVFEKVMSRDIKMKMATEDWRNWNPNNTNSFQKIQFLRGIYSMAIDDEVDAVFMLKELNDDEFWNALQNKENQVENNKRG